MELILNILLLSGVAFVTFAARAEQERGLTVPLFAAITGPNQPKISSNLDKPALNLPVVNPNAVTNAINSSNLKPEAEKLTNTVGQAVGTAKDQTSQSFGQAWGTLQIWAAGLDGKITQDELKKIQSSLESSWNGSQPIRDYLKSVNDRINSGQTDQVINEALRTLSQQAADKKSMAIGSVVQFMRDNGISLEQTKEVLAKWVGEALKMSPMDLINALKF